MAQFSINAHQVVTVEGKVLRTRIGEHIPIEHSTVDLQLKDGQFLQTNVRNLVEGAGATQSLPDTNAELKETKQLLSTCEKALAKSREEVYEMQGELIATRELLIGAEKRIAELSAPKSVVGKRK